MAISPARRRWAAVLLIAGLALAGCSEDPVSEDRTPEEVLALAKSNLDGTSGLSLSLSTADLPAGVTGVIDATGVATHDPAFDGTITVPFAGNEVGVPVIAVDGKVYAQIPMTTGWNEVDPAAYGAPDPAALMDTEAGLSSLLVETEKLAEGDTVRGGQDNAEQLTTYTGTVPAEVVARVIPQASGDDFDATYLVNADGRLIEANLTGQFYPNAAENTYNLLLSDYDSSPDITKP